MTDNSTNKVNDKKGFDALKPIHKAACIALVSAAALIAICLVTKGMGAFGGGIRALLRGLFSWGSVIIPIALVAQAVSFADDLSSKRFGKRSAFALVSTVLVSCIEYAIASFGSEPVFSPTDAFINMNNGGFLGSTIGFALSKLFGQLGVVIIAVMALAIYAVFFFAEKAGSLGQAALNFAASIKRVINFVKDKHKAHEEKKRQIKEDADQHQREVKSEELIDDEFFKARGGASEIKIKKLGIEENASTHGLSAIHDPEQRVIEEPVIIEEEPEVRRRRADKPLDLTYGIESDSTPDEQPEEKTEEKPAASRASFGLDDSADSVFTRDFDPFDFATSEKKAAKYASKVAGNSAVTEELDDMTIYQMKADHEPDARERRLMELERKKQEYMRKRQPNQPAATPSPAVTNTAPVNTEPTAPTAAAPQPAPTYTPTPTPIASESLTSDVTSAPATNYTPTPGYTPAAKPAAQRPIKTVEFTISKGIDAEPTPPAESKPISMTVEKPAHTDDSEDVAKLISQRVAEATPGYARSANDLKTYTKVVTDGDDELYRLLEGIPTETVTHAELVKESVAEAVLTESPVNEEILQPTEEITVEPSSESAEELVLTDESEQIPEDNATFVENTDTPTENSPEYVEFSVGEERPAIEQPSAQSTYQRAAGFASAMVNAPVATPEFKPYTSPSVAPAAPVVSDDNVLKAERSMLPPTPEAISAEIAKSPETNASDVNISTPTAVSVNESPAAAEVDFIPVDRIATEESDDSLKNAPEAEAEEPLFTAVEESEPETEDDEDDEEGVEISFDDDEDDEDEYEDDSDGEDEDDEADDDNGEESPEESDEDEIPPEQQNPDVIKMREMFPFLAPIGEKTPAPAPAEEIEEESEPAVANNDVPFDGAVEVKPAPFAIVPANDKKEKKKQDKPDYSDYQFPSLDFLAKQEEGADDNIQAEIQENADKLIETLASFGVTASIKGVDRGPRITRYEVVPAKGVKVSSILNLQDDIALNLAAGSIRMEAPIPGKSAVGIEIPNKKSSIVRLRDLLETPDFESNKSKTFVCIGRDVAGQPVFGDLAKMPHLLIAGATGMGKSVCINALLISVLYKARPDEVKLIMIDPKQVEFTMYNGIPHLLVPVVSDPKQAAGALMWAVEEMERRYNLLNPLCVRNIEAYNEKVTADPSLGEPMPKIIIVIDEFADLMLQVKDPVEQLVTRIAQKARAAGIHLVIGTQRPSVNVITGVIKANVPSRISCKVMSNVDSKTVLDSAGAEKLLDKGDALYAPAGSPKPHRLQCAFVADGEVEAIMNYLKQSTDGNSYDSTVMEDIERAAQKCSKKGGSADRDDSDGPDVSGEGYLNDRQFLDAVEIAVNTRKISTSLIQRKLSIGYGKAAKFIDIMEDMGIVGEANGQRPREVKLTPDEWREKLARSFID